MQTTSIRGLLVMVAFLCNAATQQESTTATEPTAKVLPGAVAWHASPEAALARAAETGKPVLVFELFGRLDEALC
jgi:hypothetical protein